MSDHYFSSRPISKSTVYKIESTILGEQLVFHADNGMFSKRGIDYGSRLLIESVEIGSGQALLDLGCAYGVVGISIVKAYPTTQVTMVDVNERACDRARENATKNGVDERVEVYHGDGFNPISHKDFDHVLMNPPIRAGKNTIYSLFADTKKHLRIGGILWVVIRKQQGAESTKRKLEELFDAVEVVVKKKGYWIVKAAVK